MRPLLLALGVVLSWELLSKTRPQIPTPSEVIRVVHIHFVGCPNCGRVPVKLSCSDIPRWRLM